MTMPSKTRLAVGLCLLACAVFAATPGEVFEANRATILADGFARADGYCFAAGEGRAATAGETARAAAPRKAELRAKANLLAGLAFARVVWPAEIDSATREALRDFWMRNHTLSATLSGVSVVYTQERDGVWTAVVALPESEAAKVQSPDYATLRAAYDAEQARLKAIAEAKAQAEAKAKALAALRANPGDRAYWADLFAKASFEVPALQALVEGKRLAAADAKPTDAAYAQAAEAFAKGDVSGAYANALASAGQAYTFDALNLAANAGRRIGKTPEAAVLALAAVDLAPESPYPWVHLAFVAKAEGKQDLCAACCDRAETLGPEDAWVRDQVKALRAALVPAVEPSETQSAGKEP